MSKHDSQDVIDRQKLEAYRQTGNQAILAQIVSRMEPICQAAIRKAFKNYLTTNRSLVEDVQAEAHLGLTRAILKFDTSRNVKLSTLCYEWAWGYALNELERVSEMREVFALDIADNWTRPMRKHPVSSDLFDLDGGYFEPLYEPDLEIEVEEEDDGFRPLYFAPDQPMTERDRMRQRALEDARKDRLWSDIQRIEQPLRSVAVLCLVKEFTQEQAAIDIGTSQATVCRKLKKAKEQLLDIKSEREWRFHVKECALLGRPPYRESTHQPSRWSPSESNASTLASLEEAA